MASTTLNDDNRTGVTSTLDNEIEEGPALRGRTHQEAGFSEQETPDENVMARFGKKQQLKRRFKSLSSIGLICGVMLTWESVIFSLQFGLANGGPAGLIWGYLATWIGALFQAVVMAEMASMIPLTGGPFNWVAILAPRPYRKFLSYMAGWLTVIGWQAFVVAISYTCATLIQGLVILNYRSYAPQLWHATLMSYGVSLFGFFMNTYLGRHLPRIEGIMLISYVLGFFAILVPLAYLGPRRSAKEVFGTYQNIGGWSSGSLSFFTGWVTSLTSFLGGDGADHVAEEIQQAQKVIPFSIWFSVLLNGALGFAILLATLFSIDNLEAATESKTGYPFMDIFVGAVGSRSGGSALVIVMTFINILSITGTIATASRVLWAFSRENSLPFSKFIAKVEPETYLPINAIIVTICINVALALISIGSYEAYLALYSITLSAYLSAFIISASCMLHKRLTTPASKIPWGPFSLGRAGVPITILALCYSVLAIFWSFWPGEVHPSPERMNYSVLIFGIAVMFSIVFWFLHGRKVYVGPIWEYEAELLEAQVANTMR